MTHIISLAAKFSFLLFILALYCSTYDSIEWHEEDGVKWAELDVPYFGNTGFKKISESETGITFANNLTRALIDSNRILLNGSGTAIGDVDGDGLIDIYFCRLDGPNVLYKNLGNWRFQDITDSAGVACREQFSTGAALADIDGDFDLDLLVTSIGGPNACFLNDGTGKFTEITNTAGITSKTGASTMALADIDGDGDLDLYITNYKVKTAKDIWDPGELLFNSVVEKVGDTHRIAPKYQDHFVLEIRDQWVLYFETGEPDALFLNDGKGGFEKVDFNNGRFLNENGDPEPELLDWGLMVRFQDMDDDGDPDIYVCNDFESPDRIWINDGQGYFQAIAKLAVRKTSNSSMAIDFSDIDRDGDLDFFVTDMLSRHHRYRMTQRATMVPLPPSIGQIDNRPQYMHNTLFLNRGDNTFAEISQFSNIQASEWSWSPLFLDVDLDGYEDVLITTGHYYDAQDFDSQIKADKRVRMSAIAMSFSDAEKPTKNNRLNTIFLFPKLQLRNVAFHNLGDLTFEEVGKEWGFTSADISHGMALGDLDNDGDMDLVINRLDTTAAIYRNESTAPRIAVRLRGLPPNTQGIGAKIRVLGGPVQQSKEVISAGAYLSSSDPLAVFAAGNAENLTIEVKWRNGKISTFEDAKPNRIYEISESTAQSSDNKEIADSLHHPYFKDVSYLITHKHHEDPFDDFSRQRLLSNRLSQLGPGVAWHDFDADGDDDLIIASGKGGKLSYFRNDGIAGFSQIKDATITSQTQTDQTTVLGWTKKDGSSTLLVGTTNFENTRMSDSFVSQYDIENGKAEFNSQIMAGQSSIGPMTMADYDGDGDLDLFVGGRSLPARYPQPASSRLYLNKGGSFDLDSLNTRKFEEIGLVSGAVFSDFDGDGDADLILAVEWGPVMVFRNDSGQFHDATVELGLGEYFGWWHGVTTGDLNEDGKLDIIATNWGLNSKFQHRYDDTHPLQLFYSDFDNNGSLDIIEAYFDNPTQRLLPERNLISLVLAMPFIRMRMPSNSKYSRSTLQMIIGPKLNQAGKLQANTLAHMVFLNRGDRFEAIEMPRTAQLAPAFYVGVADFDGDGHEDVFMSQNFFAVQMETSRSDAGRGIWLQGDGSGKLTPVAGQESGVKVYGEQRSAALSDYDRDGRVDLVVSQNGATTKLYHNVGAKPGLRIRLAGSKENRGGVGASIRLVYEDGYGPAREVHLGSGYWSQDSMVQVMGFRDYAKRIWVRWPGGNVTESDIPTGVKGIVVDENGEVTIE